MKYGGRNLTNVLEKAEHIANGEETPEEVSERNGDFYIVPITIASKQRENFYTPLHMATVSAFIKMTRTRDKESNIAPASETLLKGTESLLSNQRDICKECLCLNCGERGLHEDCGPSLPRFSL